MTGETYFVFGLLAITIILFASDRIRLDAVAMMVVLALMLSGILSPVEALAGFGDSVVLLIAGLFVVSEGLFRTGVAHAIGNWLMRVAGASEIRLLVLLMLVVAFLSAFMSSTGAVAIFIPVALNLAAKINISPPQLMMPIAFASLIGGMLTLIGTPPNLVVNGQLTREGLEPFGFFEFTPIGLLVLLIGIVYMVFLGRRWLPREAGSINPWHDRLSLGDLSEAYQLSGQLHLLQIDDNSPVIGKTVAQALLRTRYGITVLGIERLDRSTLTVIPALSHTELRRGDALYVAGTNLESTGLGEEGLRQLAMDTGQRDLVARELGLAEVLLTPNSSLIGHTLSEARFRERHGLTVLGILRMGKPLQENLIQTPLAFGDALLMGGGWKQIDLLQAEHKDFLVLNLPREMNEVAPARAKASWALVIMLAMLIAMTTGWLPNVAAVLLAALAMGFAGCVSAEDIYQSMSWQSLVLIAGMLPLATALEKTGGLALLVGGLTESLGDFGPLALMAGLFVLTSALSQFISNTATTVLIAPVAVGAAAGLSLSPYPLLMTVALAASAAFATPVASPVNTLVLGPGGYRFNDFVRLGVPLQILVMIVTLLVVPLLFPLQP